MKVYQQIAGLIQARKTCIETENYTWKENHENTLDEISKNLLPSGSGFDSGSKINIEASTSEKIIIDSGFHVMDEDGFYAEWLNLVITVKPSLQFGFLMTIKGIPAKYKFQITDYVNDSFYEALNQEYIR